MTTPQTNKELVEAAKVVCRNCEAEDHIAAYKAGTKPLSKADGLIHYPATMIGIMPVREEFKSKPPIYWAFCNSHGTLAMIAGFNPVMIDSEIGQRRLAALQSNPDNIQEGGK